MLECSDLFIGMDVSKDRYAVAVADGGRDGEMRFYGEIGSDGGSARRFVRKLDRTQLRGHRAIPDPASAGRAGEDEPPRCCEAGTALPRWRADRDLDPGRSA